MHPKRLSVKFFLSPDPEAPVELEPFIPLFHRVIQQGSVPGLLLDVADYMHVPAGPGVVLIGHDVDYAIDGAGGRAGLLTLRKRAGNEPLGELLRDTLHKALSCVRAIEADGSAKVSFAVDAVRIDVVDRLVAENIADAFEAMKAEVEPVFEALYGDATLEFTRSGEDDPRKLLGVHVAAEAASDVDTLIRRVAGTAPAPPRQPAPAAPRQTAPAAPRQTAPAAPRQTAPAVPRQTEWDVSVEQLAQMREDGADFVLIDVREPHEVEICAIGGRLIPLGELEGRLSELDPGAHIVVHCHTGGRSAHAVRAMRGAGFENTWNLQGGMRAWIQRIDSTLDDY